MTALASSGCATKPRGDLAYSRNLPLNDIVWEETQRFTFDKAESLDGTQTTNGKWLLRDGRLEAVEGEERSILLTPCTSQTLRIEFDATCQPNPDGRIGDISILVNIEAGMSYWKSGYLFTTASYYNECSSFYREGVRIANTEFSPVTPGQTHHIMLEMHGGRIRYWLDGRVLLEANDPSPLPSATNRWIGLRTYNTCLQVEHLVVSSGVMPTP